MNKQERAIKRAYDTVDVAGSRAKAIDLGMAHVSTRSINDDQDEIILRGTLAQHQAFATAEGYEEGEWSSANKPQDRTK